MNSVKKKRLSNEVTEKKKYMKVAKRTSDVHKIPSAKD